MSICCFNCWNGKKDVSEELSVCVSVFHSIFAISGIFIYSQISAERIFGLAEIKKSMKNIIYYAKISKQNGKKVVSDLHQGIMQTVCS